MPLMSGRSNKAFSSNVKSEMDAGKPQNQSLAIAYAMKRKAKKMADGGGVTASDYLGTAKPAPQQPHPLDPDKAKTFSSVFKADGGMIEEDEMQSGYGSEPHPDEHMDSGDGLLDKIMKKRQMYSKGGQVANQEHGENDNELAGFSPNEFDDLVLRDDDLEGADYTGANSGDMLGNAQEDSDRHDIIAQIMKSRAKKDRLPNPR